MVNLETVREGKKIREIYWRYFTLKSANKIYEKIRNNKMGEQEGKKRDRFKTRKKIVLIREKYAYIHRNNAYIRCQGYIAIKLMIKKPVCIPHRMERSWKGHVIAWKIKNILRAYSLVRRLCHDSKYRSLHSKPTLSHTSPFSSHRKDIRSRDIICGAFLDEYQHRHSAPDFLSASLPLLRHFYFALPV